MRDIPGLSTPTRAKQNIITPRLAAVNRLIINAKSVIGMLYIYKQQQQNFYR